MNSIYRCTIVKHGPNHKDKCYSLNRRINGVASVIFSVFPFSDSSECSNAKLSYRLAYYDANGNYHNPTGPALIIWCEDLESRICFYYIHGNLLKCKLGNEYSDFLKDKKIYRDALAMLSLANTPL